MNIYISLSLSLASSKDVLFLDQPRFLPVGPFCPFRSDFWSDPSLQSQAEEMAIKQQREAELTARFRLGQTLTPEEKSELCSSMKASSEYWISNQMRLRYADDFQALESFKITEVKLEPFGFSMDTLEALVKWTPEQVSCMLEGRPPTPPPAGLNMMKIQQASQSLPTIMSLSDMKKFSSFVAEGSEALQSELVQEELKTLTTEHQALISLGSNYRQFDPRGKEAYLDQIALVQERWKIFMTRFQLMGELNPDFLEESQRYLMQVGMTIEQFNSLIQDVHQRMREDAQKEALR